MRRSLLTAVRDDSGATAIEYGLIAGCVSLAVIGGATAIGADLAAWFQQLADAL